MRLVIGAAAAPAALVGAPAAAAGITRRTIRAGNSSTSAVRPKGEQPMFTFEAA